MAPFGALFGGGMLTSYYIEPENKFLLASISSHPIVQQLEIERIGIDPEERTWTFVLKGSPQGDQQIWDEIRTTMLPRCILSGQAVRNKPKKNRNKRI